MRAVFSGSQSGRGVVEVLVALTILALGGTLATRLLVFAHREMDGAELELRAVLHLAELIDEGGVGLSEGRPAGPGRLKGTPLDAGWEVSYQLPSEAGPVQNAKGPPGFLREAQWVLGAPR